ncbi:tryptophanyl-tRNA synthetase, mitochondrial isoform X2 [Nomia melanderi]|uniref:tryptophanyl-tRNA synthetase, mitochondrial isoform X2 n=1 Tax=Nomia melanderi TaxID=2448451 RepID=UPI0013042A71|nr:tryptophan--tRNA ligase, mitochondrial isoform X1 [Nomia melanderi]
MFTPLTNIFVFRNITYKCMHMKQCNRKVSTCNYPKRIFSAIQPTGDIHVGNYLGTIKKWVQLQDEEENVLWSVADLHSMTMPHDPKQLHGSIIRTTATLLACGIDPKKSILFQQSAVPMHTELCWVLGCVTTLARLGRLPQFREKSKTLKNIPLGLYIYPVLQAADILLYRTTHVPCGQDQIQHVELARELAVSFNKKFGCIFCIPNPLINENASQRIKSLRDPAKKMSKSSNDPKSKINILDEPDILLDRIKKAITDVTSEVTYEPEKRPGVANLITIHSVLTGKMPDQICLEVKGLDTGKYKLLLADLIIEKLHPIREEFSRLIKEPVYLNEVLKNGKERATEIAEVCWHEVRDKVGIETDVSLRVTKRNIQSVVQKI